MLDADALLKEFQGYHADTRSRMDALTEEVKGTKSAAEAATANLLELEQKMARRGSGGGALETKSWGQQFAEDADVQAFCRAHGPSEGLQRKGRIGLQLKTTITTGNTSAGPLASQPFRDDVVSLPRRRLTVRNLLPTVRISTGSVEWPKMTARPSAAAMVAEGATKPESAMAFTQWKTPRRVLSRTGFRPAVRFWTMPRNWLA